MPPHSCPSAAGCLAAAVSSGPLQAARRTAQVAMIISPRIAILLRWRDSPTNPSGVRLRKAEQRVHARVAPEAAIQIEAAIEPVPERVILVERRSRRDRSRPQKDGEHAVVRVVRLVAAEPRSLLEQLAERFELRRHEWQPLFAAS